ncbi:MAG TPA: Flp family type IVb pilin [Candidatus Limnocylindria bacterium]|nr:Flp family type IVb pilin [Candidatus Limnocylindria bacterium]
MIRLSHTIVWVRAGIRVFVRDERAAGLVEYALIVAVVALGVLLALAFVAGGVGNVFEMVSDTLEGALTGEDPIEVGRRRGRGWCRRFGC